MSDDLRACCCGSASLGGEMDHPVNRIALGQGQQPVMIGKVELAELEPRQTFKLVKPLLLVSDVVIGIEIVEAEDAVALLKQGFRDLGPDKTRNACD